MRYRRREDICNENEERMSKRQEKRREEKRRKEDAYGGRKSREGVS